MGFLDETLSAYNANWGTRVFLGLFLVFVVWWGYKRFRHNKLAAVRKLSNYPSDAHVQEVASSFTKGCSRLFDFDINCQKSLSYPEPIRRIYSGSVSCYMPQKSGPLAVFTWKVTVECTWSPGDATGNINVLSSDGEDLIKFAGFSDYCIQVNTSFL